MGDDNTIPKIVIFGVGGAGNKIVNTLAERPLPSTTLVAVDTANQHLLSINDRVERIPMKQEFKDRYLDSQNFSVSRDVIEKDLWKIEQKMEGANLVLIVAGLGRVTGTYMSAVPPNLIHSIPMHCAASVSSSRLPATAQPPCDVSRKRSHRSRTMHRLTTALPHCCVNVNSIQMRLNTCGPP